MFSGVGGFLKDAYFFAQSPGIIGRNAELGVVEFDLKQIDDFVIAVNQKVNLSALFRVRALFDKRRGTGINARYAQRLFYLRDMLQADVFKGITAPGFISLGLAEMLPGLAAIMRFILHKLKVEKGILIREAVEFALFLFAERKIGRNETGLF